MAGLTLDEIQTIVWTSSRTAVYPPHLAIIEALMHPDWQSRLSTRKDPVSGTVRFVSERKCMSTCDACNARVCSHPDAWQCLTCGNYDLCDGCYMGPARDNHGKNHDFVRY